MHVTNIKECIRRYGSNAKTKELRGIVTDVVNKRNKKTNRSSTFICAIYDLDDDNKKRVELNIRYVHSAPTSGSSDRLNVPPHHPVLNLQNLHPTTEPTIPPNASPPPTTTNTQIVLQHHTSPQSALTMPTVGASTAYGTNTSVASTEQSQQPAITHATTEQTNTKPPPAHPVQPTLTQTTIQQQVATIQPPQATQNPPANTEGCTMNSKRGIVVAETNNVT